MIEFNPKLDLNPDKLLENEDKILFDPFELINSCRTLFCEALEQFGLPNNSLLIHLTTPFDFRLISADDYVSIGLLTLLALNPTGLDVLPTHLKPNDTSDELLDDLNYWLRLEQWLVETFNLSSFIDDEEPDVEELKKFFILLMENPKELRNNLIELFILQNKNRNYSEKVQMLEQLVVDIQNVVGFKDKIFTFFSKPIDPSFASSTNKGPLKHIEITPLTFIDFHLLPENIRPNGSADERLFDLEFLQALSDWIAEEFQIQKKRVSLLDIAAVKTVLKLKENPEQFQRALRACIAHEIGHLEHEHIKKYTFKPILPNNRSRLIRPINWIKLKCHNLIGFLFDSKRCEFEADTFAANNLADALQGFEDGFGKWQESLLELRNHKRFDWKTKLTLKIMITPSGNGLSLLFTHGSFQERIKHASKAMN